MMTVMSKNHSRYVSKLYHSSKTKIRGLPMTESHKKKISESLKGRSISIETSKKISETLKGRKLSEEHKDNMKKSRATFEVSVSVEEKKKVYESRCGRKRTQETKDKQSASMKGIHSGKKWFNDSVNSFKVFPEKALCEWIPGRLKFKT